MTTTYPFIVQLDSSTFVQAPRLNVQYRERRRTTKLGRVVGMDIVTTEHAGWDRSTLVVRAVGDEETPVLSATGGKTHTRATSCAADAGGIKTTVRRIKPADAAELVEIDADIASADQLIRSLRLERKRIVAAAFRRGALVWANELHPEDDQPRKVTE